VRWGIWSHCLGIGMRQWDEEVKGEEGRKGEIVYKNLRLGLELCIGRLGVEIGYLSC